MEKLCWQDLEFVNNYNNTSLEDYSFYSEQQAAMYKIFNGSYE